MKSAEEFVRDVLIKHLGELRAELVTPEANLRNTLEMDSLDMFLVSTRLGIDIPKGHKPKTVQDLIDLVEQQNK